MERPMIGLIPLYDEEKKSYWMLPDYMKAIEAEGGIPVMLPLSTDVKLIRSMAARMDGLLVTGGQDVSPTVYNEPMEEFCGELCPDRDTLEAFLIPMFLEADKPVLGICRGMQMLNALLGGSLYQDLPAQLQGEVPHRQKKPYSEPSHAVTLEKESPLYKLLGKESISVNSCHHQGINGLALPLEKMAESVDGLIEAVYMPEQTFVWGVQWHPEMSYEEDEDSRKILGTFVNACKKESGV